MPPPARDAPDGGVASYQMHRAFSIDSALNVAAAAEAEHLHISGYDNVIYEVESEAEAQDFLAGGDFDSDNGTAARSRVVTRRKTQPRKAARTKNGTTVQPRARRAIRKESMDVDVVNDG